MPKSLKTPSYSVTLRIIDSNGIYHFQTLKVQQFKSDDPETDAYCREFVKLVDDVRQQVVEITSNFGLEKIKDLKLFYKYNVECQKDFNFHLDTDPDLNLAPKL
jgi:hypothetical protein